MDNCMEHSKVIEMLNRDEKRLNDHDTSISEFAKFSARLTVVEENNSALLKTHDERITAVEMQPASTFKEIRGYLLSAAVGAAFAYLPQIMTIVR